MTKTNQLRRELESTQSKLVYVERELEKEELNGLFQESEQEIMKLAATTGIPYTPFDLDDYYENIELFELEDDYKRLSLNESDMKAQISFEAKRERKANWIYQNPNKRPYEGREFGPVEEADMRKMNHFLDFEINSEVIDMLDTLAKRKTVTVHVSRPRKPAVAVRISDPVFDFGSNSSVSTTKEWAEKAINKLRKKNCNPEETLHMIVSYALTQDPMKAKRFADNFGIKLPETQVLKSVKASLESW